MSLCRRIECAACNESIEDNTLPSWAPGNGVSPSRQMTPNLGAAACARFLTAHRGHKGVRALALDDEIKEWKWSTPTLVRRT